MDFVLRAIGTQSCVMTGTSTARPTHRVVATGATFHISFQAQTPSDVPKSTWALYEDPRQLAVDAAEASVLEAPDPSPPVAYSGCHDAGGSPPSEDIQADTGPEGNRPAESAEFAGSNQYSAPLTQSQSQDRHHSNSRPSTAATKPSSQTPGAENGACWVLPLSLIHI